MSLFGKLTHLNTLHGSIAFPTFFPDGTLGVVRGVDSTDLENAEVEGIVINAYHLLVAGMDKKVKLFSGIHEFMRWERPIITDSGGFQVMSLVHDHPDLGKISDQGITFKYNGEKVLLTPEKSIEIQLQLGTDMAIVLDDCTRSDMSLKDQKKSVERTIAWAKRCKEEFERLASQPCKAWPCKANPLLFAVVQGGNNKNLRKYCASELIKIGFDGYCFGGFPVEDHKFLSDIVKYTASLLPDDKPKYALGVGKPENIVACVGWGYGIFDCVIPTREARHKKLYVFTKNPTKKGLITGDCYSNIYFGSAKYEKSMDPVSKFCDCLTCREYSRAYLHHLFKIQDVLSIRLATIHNLRFYSILMETLK